MPSKPNEQALLDILHNSVLAQDFVAGFDFKRFVDDRRTVYAVTRALEIISEAARRIPAEIAAAYPHIPWNDIKAAGNVYRHEYEDVLEGMLWETVQNSLAPLEQAMRQELGLIEKP